MTKVSFILPAYKRRFLHDAVASILAQTYRDFELIVVDDCSPEDLKSIVDEFHDERLTYHRNAENIGGKDLVAAWTRAMEYARGEWCVLASDDDIYVPEYLEEMVRLSEKYPHVDLFHCRPCQIDANGAVNIVGHGRMEFETCLQMMHHRLVLGCRQTMPDFMFRVKALKDIGGFVKFDDAMHSDTATWLMLSKAHGVVCSSRILFSWRDSGVNVSMRKDNIVKKVRASLAYQAWLIDFLSNVNPTSEEDGIIKRLMLGHISRMCTQDIRRDMTKVPLTHWIKALVSCNLPSEIRNRVVYDRICRMMNPRFWVVK